MDKETKEIETIEKADKGIEKDKEIERQINKQNKESPIKNNSNIWKNTLFGSYDFTQAINNWKI